MRRIAPALVIAWFLVPCTTVAATPPAPAAPATTAADADQFIAGINHDLRGLLNYYNVAAWVQETYITDDTQKLGARANEEFLAYTAQKLQESKRYNGLSGLSPDTARSLMLLKNVSAPPPSDAAKQAELAKILSDMDGHYGSAKWCRSSTDCLNLTEIEKILDDPRQTPEARATAWAGWHEAARPIKAEYARFVQLANEGAREMGFADTGEVWRGGYDMTPAEFQAEVERLWAQVQPLYEQLHCYVRAKLNAKYGDRLVPKQGLIPAHLLGNMWAQQWSNIYPLVEPYPGAGQLDVSAALKKQRDDEYHRLLAAYKGAKTPQALDDLAHQADSAQSVRMAKMAEDFYVSLGFPHLPASFWKNSMLTRPRDREVVCHASAWDLDMSGDVRIKMCIEPNEDDLITIHHELGHIYYDLSYNALPPLFQNAAHDGFHEAIGDTMTLSLTPAHLHKIGLAPAVKPDARALINSQMKWALDKIVFLPWGKLVDQWRWQVFSGEVKPEQYNDAWWKLRARYQGVSPPVTRSADDFDPGAKYHVASNTPYTRYFLSFVLQFQFQKALCDAAGFKGPLNQCDIYGNAEAGRRYAAMLAAGASR
ncbi:MAG TPA: M2 family metallopeptidase, partial [Nevskiaceae bacterium]|nr:M2 family metallopeptidase [Nevskiaceae bacterium]